MFYTYCHYRLDTNKIFYIGKGKDNRAWVNKRNKHWHGIADRHGWRCEILAYWSSEAEALEHEIMLIACFIDLGYKLANKTAGGQGTAGLTPWNKGLTGPSLIIGGTKAGSKRPGIGGRKIGSVPWNKGVTGYSTSKKGTTYVASPKLIEARRLQGLRKRASQHPDLFL